MCIVIILTRCRVCCCLSPGQHFPRFTLFYSPFAFSSFLALLIVQVFFSNMESSTTADKKLVDKARRFRLHLTKRFNWDFESEPEEFAPVVVETWCVYTACTEIGSELDYTGEKFVISSECKLFFFFVGPSGKPSKGHKVIPLFMLKTRGFAGFPGIAIGTA